MADETPREMERPGGWAIGLLMGIVVLCAIGTALLVSFGSAICESTCSDEPSRVAWTVLHVVVPGVMVAAVVAVWVRRDRWRWWQRILVLFAVLALMVPAWKYGGACYGELREPEPKWPVIGACSYE